MKHSTLALILVVVAGCATPPDDAHVGHTHEGDESWTVTAWGDMYEVFSEGQGLTVGHDSEVAVHVTVLEHFAPLTEGRVTIQMTDPAGGSHTWPSDAPARDGIYVVSIRPVETGDHALAFLIEAPAGTETLDGGTVRVGTHEEPGGVVSAPHQTPPPTGEPVPFLKEQQWRTSFATEAVPREVIRATVGGPARVRPAAQGEVLLTAPFDAVLAREPWPWSGRAVAAGEPVLQLIPRAGAERSLAVLEAEVRTLEAEQRLAAERVERLEGLLAAEATSRAERDRAVAAAEALEARLLAARADLDNAQAARTGARPRSALALSAPWAARVAEIRVTPGEAVSAGAPLVRLVKPRPVWLEVALRPEDAARITSSSPGLHLRRAGSNDVLSLDPDAVRLVSRAPEIDARTATQTVILELQRDADSLPLGTSAQVEVVLDDPREGTVIPTSALVDDGGQTVAYVQLEGESFARREIQVLAREGNRVLVDGLGEGERVVTEGGATIRRTTLLSSGGGAEHVH